MTVQSPEARQSASGARPDDPSVRDAADVVRALATDLDQGLGAEEVARRLERDGPNELRAAPPVPAWRRFLAQFEDPLIYLLLAAIVIALVAWILEGRHRWPVDGVVIASIVLANAVLGFIQEARAENAVAALARILSQWLVCAAMASAVLWLSEARKRLRPAMRTIATAREA